MKTRPKISIYIATSIDGYIARKDGTLDWLDRVGGFDEDYGFQKLLESIDAVILGRNTYELAASVQDWPYKGKRIIVLSNTLTTVRPEAELYKGDLTQLISQLHADKIKHIWIDGGVTISQFLDLHMVDSMTLSVIPVVLGSGIPLFRTIGHEIPCRITSSQHFPSGLVQLHYEIIKEFSPLRDKLHFKIIEYGSDEYKKSVALREEILRKPLGLIFTQEEIELEKDNTHIVGFLGAELCAAVVLVPESDSMKMQRVAIKCHLQNRGIGSALMGYCEKHASENGHEAIYCFARLTAVPFYVKNNYIQEGESFDLNGTPHRKMRKILK